jgi:hypothetical protein
VDPSWAGLGDARPAWPMPVPEDSILEVAPGWHPGRGGARAQGWGPRALYAVVPLSSWGPHPPDPVRALERETKALGGPGRAGTQAGDGVLMTTL